jgi:hypothetical protein
MSILYRNKDSLRVGELFRYTITYTPDTSHTVNPPESCLWLRVKNLEAVPLRAAYLAGPYILYVDVRPGDYDQNRNAYSSADQPIYEPQLKAGQSMYAQLYMNKVGASYTWVVDVVSQVIFSPNAQVQFELTVGNTKDALNGDAGKSVFRNILVEKRDTLDIWHSPTPRVDSPLHLVVVTHGLHSNTGVDMLYIKEKIDERARKTGENVVVRGFFDNVCRTEKGIKYLGRRLGDYVVKALVPSLTNSGAKPVKISFIAHSLGGLVQTFALAHIQSTQPDFFDHIQAEHFICLATPFLGISNENPKYVKFALDVGFAGKTGRDLGLTWKAGVKQKPLLQILPTGPAHQVLQKFKTRTLYANAMNDGIVPLRTSAILYLDWRGISKAARAELDSEYDSKDADHASEIPSSTHSPTSNGVPFLSFFSFMAPQAGSKRKIYKRGQIRADYLDDEDNLEGLPRSTSMIESGMSVLVPPLPSPAFINDPATRAPTIFHDRIYTEEDLPPRLYKAKTSIFGVLKRNSSSSSDNPQSPTSIASSNSDEPTTCPTVEKSKLEERMARAWHQDLSWRKVLVRLEPDAHNNIVVRRRFANAYGWPVIDHLVDNHFSVEPERPSNKKAALVKGVPCSSVAETLDSYEDSQDLSSLVHELEIDEKAAVQPTPKPRRRNSESLAWEHHLKVSNDDSDDEGIVLSVGGWIDNFRDISIPVALKSEFPTEPLESETVEERLKTYM